MTAQETATQANPEVILTRVFAAPRPLVWRAWTDATELAKWWGPTDFTNPRCEVDLREGGALHIDMMAPDGALYPMTGTFLEVIEPERLVFSDRAFEDGAGGAGLEGQTEVTFEEVEGGTRVTVRAVLTKVAPELVGAAEGMEEGWAQSLDKLAALLAA